MWGSDADRREFAGIWPLWHGSAGERDRRRAVQRLKPLADRRYAPAQFALGWALFDGDGVRRDYVKAFEQFLAAANQGYPSAEGMVGGFHAMVKPAHGACAHDPAEAARWYRRAAEHGNAGAMTNLATGYRTGLGVDADPAEAYVWAGLAARASAIRNRPAEVMRDQAAAELDDERRAEADRRVAALERDIVKPWSEHSAYWKHLWQAHA